MSPASQAAPLPECAMCEAPTRRDAHDRNGGLCSECAGQLVRAVGRRARLITARRKHG